MNKCIVICDDDEGILDVTTIVLENYGYRVVPVINSLKVLDIVDHEKPDLVILDLWMPVMNGEQVAEALRANPATSDVPIIMISASRDGRQIAEKTGANDFIEKPFDIKTLTGKVREYV